MIAPMTKYSFVLLNGQQEELLEQLQELGLMDITRSIKPVDGQSQEISAEMELLNGLIQGLRKGESRKGQNPLFTRKTIWYGSPAAPSCSIRKRRIRSRTWKKK